MARLVSPVPEDHDRLRNPLTEGEKEVFSFFNDNLPEAWEIYLQAPLNGLQPDVVLLNPRIGIAVFEVKDSTIDTIAVRNPSSLLRS